jgi:hypothetical protein
MTDNVVVEAFLQAEDWPQLESWASDILDEAGGQIITPDTYSMRQALDNIWARGECEKTWLDGQNAYYRKGHDE